jgi:hypothetical protein
MKKTILICAVMVALAAMTITSCISWKEINLSDDPFCKTPIVRAEIKFRIDSANYIIGWTEPEPYDFQPLVDYLCHCRVLQEPIKFAASTGVKLYDSDNNEYSLGFSKNGGILKKKWRVIPIVARGRL